MESQTLEDNFIESVFPGNYWITKSMEFTKKETSGTLWYLKKFLVFYYYLFFTDKFETTEGISEIVRQIDDFILSLPAEVQVGAESFFYPAWANLKSGGFKSYPRFITKRETFTGDSERRNFILNAKKYYFMYLMGSAGQSGHKKVMKEILVEAETFEEFADKTENYFDSESLNKAQKKEMYNDFPAVIRNERQIYFYYGFFHGSETASLGGFYKLTPVGNAIVQANFHELLLIWEHQKLRMVSQSPITEIHNLDRLKKLSDDQKLSIIEKIDNQDHPYYIFLKLLVLTNSIDPSVYKYIVSRSKNYHTPEELVHLLTKVDKQALIQRIDAGLEPFGRKADKKNNDFEKERKKYILGLQQLRLDKNKNYLAFLDDDGENVLDKSRAELIHSIYSGAILYSDHHMSSIYKIFSQSLKAYYARQIEVKYTGPQLNSEEVIFNWYNYIINFDRTIIALLIYGAIKIRLDKLAAPLSISEINNYFEDYPLLAKSILGVKNRKQFSEIIGFINNQHQDGVLDLNDVIGLHTLLNEDPDESFTRYEGVIEDANLQKLKEYSQDNTKQSVRQRDPRIIKAMRGYYRAEFRDAQELIECDSCGTTTFINQNGIAYLEFHHLIPYSLANGPDHYLNLAGICPLCHRKFHGLNRTDKPRLYQDFEQKNHLKIDLNQRLDGLYTDNALEPLHLNFLIAEGAINREKMEEMLSRDIVVEKHDESS